jgi:hypothetical protein
LGNHPQGPDAIKEMHGGKMVQKLREWE